MSEPIYIIAATPDEWAQFDAAFPNQDADSGAPYRRRYPRKDVPDFTTSEGGLESRAYSCELVTEGSDEDGWESYPAIILEPVAKRGFTSRQ
jgi:hypothetical protein